MTMTLEGYNVVYSLRHGIWILTAIAGITLILLIIISKRINKIKCGLN